MATQFDSLQISQLKYLALGLHHEPRNLDLDVSCAKASRSPPATTCSSTSNKSQNLNTTSPKGRHVSSHITNHNSPSPSAPSKSPRSPSQSPTHRPCASDAELPSTVPDSASLRMKSYPSQVDGDTQPISQRVLDEFISKSKLENAAKHLLVKCDGSCTTHESSLCSYHQGQTGFVDLVGGLEQPGNNNSEEPSPENDDDELDPLSPTIDVRAELYPESKRFQQPKTPATSGKKRNHAGEIIRSGSSSSRPPINPFAGNMTGLDAMMNPSQAFKATQAASSPLTHVQYSDSLSGRPSPDMYSIQRPTPTRVMSSPTQITSLRMVRAVTEPQTTYISMQESQAKREILARRSAMELGKSGTVSSDEDFESDDTQLRRRLNRKKIDLKARGQLIGVTAPQRPVSRGRGKGGTRKQFQSRRGKDRSGREASEALVISDDLPEEGNVTEDETEHEEDQDSLSEEIDELADDNKENIEVPMTISRPKRRKSPGVGLESTPSRPYQINTPSSSVDQFKARMGPHGNAGSSNVNIPEGTQTSVIADSQPPPYIESVPQRSEVMTDQPLISSLSEAVVPKRRDVSMLSTSQLRIELQGDSQADQAVGSVVNSTLGSHDSANSLRTGFLVPPKQISPSWTSNQSTNSAIAQTVPHASEFPRGNVQPRLPGGDQSATGHQDQKALGNQDDSKGSHADTYRVVQNLDHSATVPDTTGNQAQKSIQRVVEHSIGVIPALLPSTIPETSSAVHSKCKPDSESVQPQASNRSTPFETAQTTIKDSPSKLPYIGHQLHSSRQVASSSVKSVPGKSLAQIALDPSPLDAIGEVDVDIDLLTSEDIEFQTVIDGSSPARREKKRRRGNKGHTLRVGEPKSDVLPADVDQNAVKDHTNPDLCITDELAADYSASGKSNGEKPVTTSLTRNGQGSSVSLPSNLTASSQGRTEKIRPLTQSNLGHMTGENTKTKVSHVAESVLPVSLPEKTTNPWDPVKKGIPDPNFVASDRVFAHFNGNPSAYFPATCMGVGPGDKPRYTVCFDDGQIDKVGGFNVRRLELRVGDTIKVLNSRKETFVVQGFADRLLTPAQPDPQTLSKRKPIIFCDVFGYQTVIVSLKQPKSLQNHAAKHLSVPLKDVYLTQTMWGKFKDRPYIPVVPESSFELPTPSGRPSTPSTPNSHNRRPKTSLFASPQSATSPKIRKAGLFAKTVFAVTFASDSAIAEETRENVTNQISVNGGRLVDSFEELFVIPSPKVASSFKQSPKKPTKSTFRITQEAGNLGFACVISDKHCRKAKYIQALALGIPCLATRWVDDCVFKQRILPYEPYLLAAGESEYLRGAIRSRVLQRYDPSTATFPQIVDNGPKLLAGRSILLIMSKGEEETTMRFYPLFTHALGACKIARVYSAEAAAKAIAKAQEDGEPWDFVYSHDHDKKSRGDENRRRLEKYLLGITSSTGQSRKHGRDIHGLTRVVGNEFVIQSLILGQLADL
ncbi:hypothetical protein MMC07_006515 [Pseudocyphellaria aurata]|nr:hypothetical protein [Pseudocyphellaria aurata]